MVITKPTDLSPLNAPLQLGKIAQIVDEDAVAPYLVIEMWTPALKPEKHATLNYFGSYVVGAKPREADRKKKRPFAPDAGYISFPYPIPAPDPGRAPRPWAPGGPGPGPGHGGPGGAKRHLRVAGGWMGGVCGVRERRCVAGSVCVGVRWVGWWW